MIHISNCTTKHNHIDGTHDEQYVMANAHKILLYYDVNKSHDSISKLTASDIKIPLIIYVNLSSSVLARHAYYYTLLQHTERKYTKMEGFF